MTALRRLWLYLRARWHERQATAALEHDLAAHHRRRAAKFSSLLEHAAERDR